MPNSFTLRDGQTVAIDFAQEPNLGDFSKLIALLELQRSFLDGSPAPQVVVDVRSATPQKVNGASPVCRHCAKPLMALHADNCETRRTMPQKWIGLVSADDCYGLPKRTGATIVDGPPDESPFDERDSPLPALP